MAKKGGKKNAKAIAKRLKIIRRNVGDAVSQELFDAAVDLRNRADAISPQLTGKHISTGTVTQVTKFFYIVSYNRPYSLWLHEGRYRLGPISKNKPSTEDGPVGRGYLRRPFERHQSEYIERVGEAAMKAVRQSLR